MPRLSAEEKLIHIKKMYKIALDSNLVEHYVNSVRKHNYYEILNYLENNGFKTKEFKHNWDELQRQIIRVKINQTKIKKCCSNYASGNNGPYKIIFLNKTGNWSDEELFFLLLCKFNFLFATDLQLIEECDREVLAAMLLRVGINRNYHSISFRENYIKNSDRNEIYNGLCELFRTPENMNKENHELSAMLEFRGIYATSYVISKIRYTITETAINNYVEDIQNTNTNTIVNENPDINQIINNLTFYPVDSYINNTNNLSDTNIGINQSYCQNSVTDIPSNQTSLTELQNDPFYGQMALPSFTYNGNLNTVMYQNPLANTDYSHTPIDHNYSVINSYSNNSMNQNSAINNYSNNSMNQNSAINNYSNNSMNENSAINNYSNNSMNENSAINNYSNTSMDQNYSAINNYSNNQMNENYSVINNYSNTSMDQNYSSIPIIPNPAPFSTPSVTNGQHQSSYVYDDLNNQMNNQPFYSSYYGPVNQNNNFDNSNNM